MPTFPPILDLNEKYMPPKWTQAESIELCKLIEQVCPNYGCHVALTGGLLYKEGERKDCDLLFYRIRQVEQIDYEGLWETLAEIGFNKVSGFGWCYKAIYKGKNVDCFFPEEEDGIYSPHEVAEIIDARAEVIDFIAEKRLKTVSEF